MNKLFGIILSIFMVWTATAIAADIDQNKLKTGAVKVQDFSVPAVQQPAVKGGIIGPIDSHIGGPLAVGVLSPTDHKVDAVGILTPTDHKVDAPVGVHDKAFDVFHKHKGEIKAAFGAAEGGIIGPLDSHIDGPDEIVGPDDLKHKGETQGILIGMHKGEGEAGAVDAFHKTEAESGAVVGISNEGTADFEPPVAP